MKLVFLIAVLAVISCGANEATQKEQLYCVAEAPQILIDLWEHAPQYFENRKHVKPYDSTTFSKWRQLKKFWKKEKNEAGHFEKKESIVITTENVDEELKEMKECRKELKSFSVKHLREIEKKYTLPFTHLTMENEENPTHTLRLLHYFDDAVATAHCDTSILTCLYYRDEGLQLKINGEWISAPNLEKNQMLVTYGVPGEMLSDGNLKAVRHRVKCNKRYAVAYFHNTPKDFFFPETKNYNSSTMVKVYQEAQLWYADVNARAVRAICPSTDLSFFSVIYGWLSQKWKPIDENPIAKKESL